jgi:hypothetical protein
LLLENWPGIELGKLGSIRRIDSQSASGSLRMAWRSMWCTELRQRKIRYEHGLIWVWFDKDGPGIYDAQFDMATIC